MLLYYVCTLCSSRVIATGTVLRMGIPTIALVFIILTNPFTEKLFYFDSTGYCHGPWYLLLYISALLHIAAAAIFVAVHRDAVSRRNLMALLAVFFARRLRHRRAGRQSRGADDRLRSFAQHPCNVSDHQ